MIKNLFVLSLLLCVAFCVDCLGQHHPDQPQENWLREFGLYNEQYLYHRYDRYSVEDIVRFKEAVRKVRDAKFNDNWEGIYSFDFPDSVNYSLLSWNSAGGFFSFDIYTCHPELRTLGFGRVAIDLESVTFISGKSGEATKPNRKYVKVRWGHRRYLVNEESLGAFAEKAAGLYVEPDEPENSGYHKWNDYWVTSENEENPEPEGLPQLPLKYKHLERKPLLAKVSAVRPRMVMEDVQMGNMIYSGPVAVYKISVSAGASAGFARGMMLIDPNTKEQVFLQDIKQASSTGILVRSIDDNGKDHCLNDDGLKFNCPRLRRGSILKSKSGSFWW